ncbi:MAG: hypothetical protein IT516_17270 [Burkholderiales bacterium]|nr:hypothetical protein [Burkholderiales bacterium]
MAGKKKTAPHQAVARTPPPKRGAPPRVGPLRTLADVQTELARVYRAARTGKLPLDEAKGLGYLLQLLAGISKDATLEARVAALEEHLNAAAPNQAT